MSMNVVALRLRNPRISYYHYTEHVMKIYTTFFFVVVVVVVAVVVVVF